MSNSLLIIHNLYLILGIDYRVKKLSVDGKAVKIHLWDTAGQEKYRSVTLNFYKGVDGIILVFDLTSETSFSNIPHWIRQIKLYAAENVAMVLLGNKCDIIDEKNVSMVKIEKLCSEYSLKYIETSAKTNNNIEKAFMLIIQELLDKSQNPINKISSSMLVSKEGKINKKPGVKLSYNDDDISDISQCQC